MELTYFASWSSASNETPLHGRLYNCMQRKGYLGGQAFLFSDPFAFFAANRRLTSGWNATTTLNLKVVIKVTVKRSFGSKPENLGKEDKMKEKTSLQSGL